jgi:hypothetical protein
MTDISKQSISQFIANVMIWGVFFGLGALFIAALFVRDYKYIVDQPAYFILETLIFSAVFACLFTVIFAKTRNIPGKTALVWYFVTLLKFAVFHILTQLAGVYTIIFS